MTEKTTHLEIQFKAKTGWLQLAPERPETQARGLSLLKAYDKNYGPGEFRLVEVTTKTRVLKELKRRKIKHP